MNNDIHISHLTGKNIGAKVWCIIHDAHYSNYHYSS